MASRGPAGTHLSVPNIKASVSFATPKPNEVVSRQGGQLTKAKDTLMRTFGSSWKEASVNGKVVSITKNTWRVEWSIGGVGITLDHGKSFWKPKKTPLSGNGADAGCTSIAENPRHEAIDSEEEDHRNEDIEDDVPEEESMLEGGESDGTDPLECKLGDEVLKWEKMEGGVTIDQRAKDGCSDRQFKFIWPREVVQLKHKTEEDCWNLMFPVDWFLAQEGPLGWTNASLPANVDRFSEFQFLQCMAILYGRTLLPSGSIRNMWKKKATGVLQAMDVGGRFGLVRDRFEGWRKYLKLWPADAAKADPYARVSYLIGAFNENRKEKVSPGTGVCIDESMGKWIPFFKDTPEGIPNLTKLI